MQHTAPSSLASYDLQPSKTAQVELSENLLPLWVVHLEDSEGPGTSTSGESACPQLAHSLMGMAVCGFWVPGQRCLHCSMERKLPEIGYLYWEIFFLSCEALRFKKSSSLTFPQDILLLFLGKAQKKSSCGSHSCHWTHSLGEKLTLRLLI